MDVETRPMKLAYLSRDAFSAGMRRAILGTGIVSLLATLLLSILARSKDAPRSAGANAFSVSAIGHAAFLDLLDRLDVDVLVSRHRSLDKASPTRPLLLLEPDFRSESAHGLDILRRTRELGQPLLVVMPKWVITETDREGRWVRELDLVSPSVLDDMLSPLRELLSEVAPLDISLARAAVAGPAGPMENARDKLADTSHDLDIDRIQLFRASEDLVPLIGFESSNGPLSLVARVRDTNVTLVSDPDILNTMGIHRADHALLAVDLVTRLLGVEAVVVDETTHGFEKVDTIWEELLSFPLILVTFHLAGLLALALWAANGRFSRPRALPPRLPSGKQVLIENTAALLTLGGHSGVGLKRYFEATLRELTRAFGGDPEVEQQGLDRVARLSARFETAIDLRRLSDEVTSLPDRPHRRDLRRVLELARQIYTLKTDLLHGHRRD